MAKKAFSRRYAQAVFEIALASNELDKWRSDLWDMAHLREDLALVAWLESPKVKFEDKARLLKGLLAKASPLALNLACLLVSRGRFRLAGEITEGYQRLLNRHRGIETAEVVTAVPLDDVDKQWLSERLASVVGKKIVLTSSVDPSIIGGIVARVDGKLLDGSTRSQLLALKQRMAG